MSQPLEDMVALVTGAGGGIGGAIAQALSGLGASVVLVGRGRDALERTAAGLAGPFEVCPTDLTSDDEMSVMVGGMQRRFQDRVDIVIHSAGTYRRGTMEEGEPDDLDRQFEANVRAPYRLTRALLPALRKSRGQVVFVNSSQGLTAAATLGPYAATQHALKAIADSLRDEVNEDGIRVLTVHVGRTATPRQEKIFRDEGRAYRPELLIQPEDVASAIVSCLTLPRTAEVTSLNIRPMIKSY